MSDGVGRLRKWALLYGTTSDGPLSIEAVAAVS